MLTEDSCTKLSKEADSWVPSWIFYFSETEQNYTHYLSSVGANDSSHLCGYINLWYVLWTDEITYFE